MKKHGSWRIGVPPANAQIHCIRNCMNCGNLLTPRTRKYVEKHPLSFCNPSCQIKWQNVNTDFNKGTNNPSYTNDERVGGKHAHYGEGFTTQLRRQVKIRDGYNCQGDCKLNFSGIKSRQLDVHHIDLNKYNNDLSNLICLCKKCHTALHWKLGKYV